MKLYPGRLEEHILCNYKLPEKEYDENGIPYGIQIDYDNPYFDSLGNQRSVYVYRPSTLLPGRQTRSLVILLEKTDFPDVESFLLDSDIVSQAENEKYFLIFPKNSPEGWNPDGKQNLPDDIDILDQVFQAAVMWYLFPGRENSHGYLMGLMGIGTGAEMAHVFANECSKYISSLLTFGGNITKSMFKNSDKDNGMSVWMVNAKGDGYKHWIQVNELDDVEEVRVGFTLERVNPENNAKQLRVTENNNNQADPGIIERFWKEVFSQNLRLPDRGKGRVYSLSEMSVKYNPSIHFNDKMLSDNNGLQHNWYEFIPEQVQKNRFSGKKYPLMIAMHGGGSWPKTACGMFRWHELGEKEGFMTVYPNASSDDSWNSMLYDFRSGDVAFLTELINHMTGRYPVDPSRVYLSGFSNGSGMAQVMAACRPDLIAGVVAFNTRFAMHEGVYDVAKEMKKKYDYRVPVYYSYGTKDHEYPPQEGSGQFTQIRFWKWFNNIEQKPLDGSDKSGAGVPGDEVVVWGIPGGENSEFTTHKYFSLDEKPVNYYNYTIVKDLPHSVEQGLICESWEFIKKFSRNADGSLEIEE